MAENADDNDKVLFSMSSHGDPISIICKGSVTLLYSDLDKELDKINCDGEFVIIEACYSEGALSRLEDDGRVVLTSDSEGEMCLAGFFTTLNSIGLMGLVDYEGNNDKWITAEELYDWVYEDWENRNSGIPPGFSDGYEGDLNINYFDYLKWPGLLDQYNVHKPYCSGGFWRHQWYAQSFFPDYPVISAVMLFMSIRSGEGDPGPVTVSIRDDLYGEDLCSVEVDPDYFYEGTRKCCIFDLPDYNGLVPGEEYFIVLRTYGPEGMYDIFWGEDGYPEGGVGVSTDQGASWYYPIDDDFYFMVFGRPVDDPPLTPSAPFGEISGRPITEYAYVTFTSDPDSEDIYYKWDWGDGYFSDWLGPFNSGEFAWATHSWKEPGTYEIRVKAKDEYCAESDWSNPFEVTIWNDPPYAPNIDGPSWVIGGWEYNWIFNADDPNIGDYVQYIIDWDEWWLEDTITGFYPANTNVIVPQTYPYKGEFTITAYAIDQYGGIGPEATFDVKVPFRFAQGCAQGTQISMGYPGAFYFKNIEEVMIGDIVLSYDPVSQDVTPAIVSNVYELTGVPPGDRFIFNGVLEVTSEHTLFINRMDWMGAIDAQIGDCMLENIFGTIYADMVEITTKEPSNGPILPVYDLEIQPISGEACGYWANGILVGGYD